MSKFQNILRNFYEQKKGAIKWSSAEDVLGKFFRLLIIFANSLDPDQAGQNIGPDLDPNRFTL